MISGSFHVASQNWRYFSREKALAQTIGLSQLSLSSPGDVITILATPPTGSGNGFSTPSFNVPIITPYLGVNVTQSRNNIPPAWMSPVNPGGISYNQIQSGSYGGWSGMAFEDLMNVPNGGQGGQWVWPLSSGGTFLYIGFNSLDDNLSTPTTIISESKFSRANPLVIGLGANNPPDPSNYADYFYDWHQEHSLVGNGWGNFDEGNKSISHFGNALGQEIGTIVQNVPYGTWIGQYQSRQGIGFFLYLFFRTCVLRLGP